MNFAKEDFLREAESRVCRAGMQEKAIPGSSLSKYKACPGQEGAGVARAQEAGAGWWGVRREREVLQGSLGCITQAMGSHPRSDHSWRRQRVDWKRGTQSNETLTRSKGESLGW